MLTIKSLLALTFYQPYIIPQIKSTTKNKKCNLHSIKCHELKAVIKNKNKMVIN
jgi:hypothetical protein